MSGVATSLFGLVRNRDQARHAVDTLVRAGVTPLAITAVLANRQASQDFAAEQNTVGPDGETAEGFIVGGLAGGVLGLLAGLGTMTLQGFQSLGAYITLGPIVTVMAGIGSGCIVGGMLGTFGGVEIPEYEAEPYHQQLEQGAVLLSVDCDSTEQVTRLTRLLRELGAEHVDTLDKSRWPEFDEQIHYDLRHL